MSKRNKVNKGFDVQCTTNNLVIDPSNGEYYCISKETPNSRKFDKTPCQLFACPHYREIKRENIGEKEQKIRKYIQQNKSRDWILENTPCSRRHYYDVKRKIENEELNDKDRFPNYREALTYALYQKYRWTSHNIKEIKDYIKPLLQKLPHNRLEGIFTIQRIIDLHERNLIQRGRSTSLIIASSAPSRYLFDGRYTLKELWNDYGLELPLELDSQKHEIIEERSQLIDLFLELKRNTIEQLETLEYLEAQYVQLKAGNLNSYQKTELKVKLLTNPSYQHDPLYPELKDMLGLQ